MSQREGRMGMPQWYLEQQDEAGRADAQPAPAADAAETALRATLECIYRCSCARLGELGDAPDRASAQEVAQWASVWGGALMSVRDWASEALAANPAPAPPPSAGAVSHLVRGAEEVRVMALAAGRLAGLQEAAKVVRELRTADPDYRSAWNFAAGKLEALAAAAGGE